jgi:hypothetical protein
MTSTGTYAFNPSAGDIVLNAYSMIQIRRTEMTTQHLQDAYMASNLLMVDITNRNPLRWGLETQTVPLVLNTQTYTLSNRTIAIPVAYITTTVGSQTIDRVIGPISASEYAAVPNKAQSAPPTSFFFSLLTTPTITLWPVPDASTISLGGTLNLQTLRQVQDVDLTAGTTLDSPYRFLDAITTGLAARLADMYRPERAQWLQGRFEQKMTLALGRDQEQAPLFITPGLGNYFR